MVSGVEGRHIPHMAYFLAESSLKFREFTFYEVGWIGL